MQKLFSIRNVHAMLAHLQPKPIQFGRLFPMEMMVIQTGTNGMNITRGDSALSLGLGLGLG